MIFLTFVSFLFTFIIILLILSICIQGKKPHASSSNTKSVSVIIPFRNEAENLPKLIESLSHQNYKGDFEVLLVNDGSEDNYMEAIELNIGKCNFPVRIIESIFDPLTSLSSKQQALHLGICNCSKEWIALTDADMIFEPDWLSSLMNPSETDAQMTVGHTSILNANKRTLDLFQSYQLDFLFSIAHSFFHAGIAGSCMGNNLAFSRDAYFKSGGYPEIGYSIVEDRDLYVLFQLKQIKISITNPFVPTAFTYPVTLDRFVQQMLRWARGGFSLNTLFLIGAIFSFQNILLIFSGFGLLPNLTCAICVINFLLLWFFVFISFGKTGSKSNGLLFPFYYIFLIVESIVFPILLLIKPKVIWKGRSVA